MWNKKPKKRRPIASSTTSIAQCQGWTIYPKALITKTGMSVHCSQGSKGRRRKKKKEEDEKEEEVQGWAEVFRQNLEHQHQVLVIEDVLLNKKFSINIK